MPAYPYEIAEAREEGVRFQLLTAPVRFVGTRATRGGRVPADEPRRARCERRRRPSRSPAASSHSAADTAVKAIGQQPRASSPSGSRARARRGDRRGRPTGRTADPKFFAGGDAVNGGASVVEAVAEAKRAANAIDECAAMSGLTEIRWHARAGQGAKTASQVLAQALLRRGKSVQAFPEYGPERRGAPLRAFTRVVERADPPP